MRNPFLAIVFIITFGIPLFGITPVDTSLDSPKIPTPPPQAVSPVIIAPAATQNITIESDTFELDGKENIINASGNIVVKQRDVTMYGERALFYQKKETAIIFGDVKLIKDKMTMTCDQIIANGKADTIYAEGNIKFNYTDMFGTATKADYDMKKQSLVLKGNPQIEREKDKLSGEEIRVDLKSERITTKGNAHVTVSESSLKKKR